MKKIELLPGIKSSALGFGCASILGAKDRKTSIRAIEIALDLGINHFDVARSYGFGEAEGLVGKVLKSRRDKVVIASKFGIVPNWKANLFNPLKPAIRMIRSFGKEPQRIGNKSNGGSSNLFLNRILPLKNVTMIKSLEKSLDELNTDYLDYLFIHETLNNIEHIDEIRDTAELLKNQGKIRGFGIAYMNSQRHLHSSYIDMLDVRQFDVPNDLKDYAEIKSTRGNSPNVLFSPFNVNDNRQFISPKDKVKTLLGDFPKSVILCSMFNPEHLIENVSIANDFSN